MRRSTLYVLMVVLGFGGVSASAGPQCTDARDEGKGTGNLLKYFYDSKSQLCVPFFYKGEGGNNNRFDSDIDCIKACSPKGDQINPNGGPQCTDARDEGKGAEKLLRYFYDSKSQLCVPFFYKGEGGNNNRFDSDRDCIKACSPKGDQIYPDDEMACALPKDEGSCFAILPMHYYDNEEKDCRMFLYTGCQGNANRFKSREDCQKLCLARSGRLMGAADLPNPDEKSVSAGLIVGVLGGIVFVGALISAIVMFVLHKKSKKAERKPVPTSDIEMK